MLLQNERKSGFICVALGKTYAFCCTGLDFGFSQLTFLGQILNKLKSFFFIKTNQILDYNFCKKCSIAIEFSIQAYSKYAQCSSLAFRHVRFLYMVTQDRFCLGIICLQARLSKWKMLLL